MTEFGARARLLTVSLFVAALFCAAKPVQAQNAVQPLIVSPTDGQYVQGTVTVKGTTQIPGFASGELDFGYASDPTQTWFVIQTTSLPVTNDALASWDTTVISDGDYVLRLRVTLLDGSYQDATAAVRVRNYTPLPTPTSAVTPTAPPVLDIPTAILILASPTMPTPTPTLPPFYTPTVLPPNPAGTTTTAVYSNFWRGALLAGVLAVVLGALVRLRR
ncbi:MAG TPA: hypothetical protein VMJ64_08130 [Anaerolineales bacterium]|nr:hypothetical protein [Anaerolineales bacterium]